MYKTKNQLYFIIIIISSELLETEIINITRKKIEDEIGWIR